MSIFGTKNVGSNLPEDIEVRLAEVVNNISILERNITEKTAEVEAKKAELATLNSRVLDVNNDLENKKISSEKITAELAERELKISQKESTLDVYANALKEKEEKINKYLKVFENMRDIVNK